MNDPRLNPEIITFYGTGWCPDCKRSILGLFAAGEGATVALMIRQYLTDK